MPPCSQLAAIGTTRLGILKIVHRIAPRLAAHPSDLEQPAGVGTITISVREQRPAHEAPGSAESAERVQRVGAGRQPPPPVAHTRDALPKVRLRQRLGAQDLRGRQREMAGVQLCNSKRSGAEHAGREGEAAGQLLALRMRPSLCTAASPSLLAGTHTLCPLSPHLAGLQVHLPNRGLAPQAG